MPRYRVSIPYIVHVDVKVEADDEDEAIEGAYKHAGITAYVGNDGWDKLIGVTDTRYASITTPGDVAEGTFELNVEVEET